MSLRTLTDVADPLNLADARCALERAERAGGLADWAERWGRPLVEALEPLSGRDLVDAEDLETARGETSWAKDEAEAWLGSWRALGGRVAWWLLLTAPAFAKIKDQLVRASGPKAGEGLDRLLAPLCAAIADDEAHLAAADRAAEGPDGETRT